MKIIFIGTGSAFTTLNYHSNFLIKKNDKYFLFDAGSDIRFSLKNINMSYKDIDAVYISHLHADHCGGIEYLAYASFFDPTKSKMNLFGNGEILSKGWDSSWRGGLESIQNRLQKLEDYFNVYPVKLNDSFEWEGMTFTPIQSVHIMNGYTIVPSFGLMAHDKDTNRKVFFTADTQFCPHQINDFYNSADIIIQDCETAPYKSGVHAHYDDLKTLPEATKSKMILVHYQDNILDTEIGGMAKIKEEWANKRAEDNFYFFATKGEKFDV